MTTSLHAHVTTASRDCDGGHGNDYITELNDEEIAEHVAAEARGYNDFHDLHFKARVLSNHANFDSEFGCRISMDENGFNMSEQTDEGSRSAEVYWCTDESCDPNKASQYDQFAEMMGY